MRKFLLTLIVTMLTCIGAWAQDISIELYKNDGTPIVTTESSPLVLDVNNSSGEKIWVKLLNAPGGANVPIEGNAFVSASAFAWEGNWQISGTNGNFTITPAAAGSGKVSIKVVANEYPGGVLTPVEKYSLDLWVKVADATLATSLVAPTEAVTVAPGYSVDVPFTFAPSTAVLTCSEVPGGSDNITYTFINNVLKVTASTDAVPGTDEKSFTITPKTGSVDGEGTPIEAITIPVSVVAPVVLESISLDPSTAQTIVKGSSLPVSVVYNPANAANKNVNWSSSNSGVAYYSGGSIVANSIGTATITATPEAAGVEAATLDVTVTQPIKDANVTLEGVPTTTRVGVTGAKAVVKVNGAVAGSDFGITYSSTDESILTVNPTTGEITPVGEGSAKVKARLEPNSSTTYYTGSTTIESADITVGAEITGSFTGNPGNVTLELAEVKTVSSDYPIASWTPTETGCSTLYFVESDDESIVRGSYTQSNNGGVISVSNMQLVGYGAGTTTVRVKAVYGKVEYIGGNVIQAPLAVKYSEPISVTVTDVIGELTVSTNPLSIDINGGVATVPATASWNKTGDGISTSIEPSSSNEGVAKTGIEWDGVKITPQGLGDATITVKAKWTKTVNGDQITKEIIKTFKVTVGNKLFATRLNAITDQQVEKGKTETINVSFAPSTATFTVTSSNSDKVSANFKSETVNGVTTVDYTKLVISATNASVGDAATITITPVEGSSADPVTFNVTVAKPKLPVSDVKPKSIFYVGEEYETELVMGNGLELGVDYTQDYVLSNNVATNGATEGAISLDRATGKIVALNAGTAHIQATFTPKEGTEADNEYDVWSNGMDIIVKPGKYSLSIDVANHYVAKGSSTTINKTEVKLNGVTQTIPDDKFDIVYTIEPEYAGVTITGTTVSINDGAASGAAIVKATLTPKDAYKDNYVGAEAYAQINIEPVTADKTGIIVKNVDGVITITSNYAGAYGSIANDAVYTVTPTIDVTNSDFDTEEAAIAAIKAAEKIEMYGLIKNTDMQIFSSWVGGDNSKLVDLNMGEATMTEAITSLEATEFNVADISFIKPNMRNTNANQLMALKRLELPEPAAGQTVLPASFEKWLGNNAHSHLEWLLISNGWTEIGENAFNGIASLNTVIMNDDITTYHKACFQGTSIGVLTFPPSVTLIETAAFDGIEALSDVYFTGKVAPKVERGAWGANTYYGWGGTVSNNDHPHYYDPTKEQTFDRTGNTTTYNETRNRADYKHSNGGYMTVLHIRQDLTNEEAAAFTDVTRHYAYGYDENYPEYWAYPGLETSALTTQDGMKDGLYVGTNDGTTYSGRAAGYKDEILGDNYVWPSQTQWNRAYCVAANNKLWDGVTDIDPKYDESKELYRFVLIAFDAPTSTDYDLTKYGDNLWWSICIPFNMTAQQVKKAFGEETEVCKLETVTRNVETGVRLSFTDEQIHNKNVEDDAVIIQADYPYMIHPRKGNGAAPTKMLENVVMDAGAFVKSQIVESSDGHQYQFVGNYTMTIDLQTYQPKTLPVPQHSYYLTNVGTGRGFAYQPNVGKGHWNLNTALVIGPADDDEFLDIYENNAPSISLFGVAPESTAVEKVEIVCGEKPATEGLYNLAGQKVGDDYKGIVIKNGKKYLVK